MKIKSIIRILLIVFVVGSLGYLIAGEFDRHSPEEISTPSQTQMAPSLVNEEVKSESGATAYYFHGNRRCPTCRKIEASAREALETEFAQEIKDGKLTWRVVNIQEPGNEHFIQDYNLTASSLVIVKKTPGGKEDWGNLTQVWQLVHDKPSFDAYVQKEVRVFLEKDNG